MINVYKIISPMVFVLFGFNSQAAIITVTNNTDEAIGLSITNDVSGTTYDDILMPGGSFTKDAGFDGFKEIKWTQCGTIYKLPISLLGISPAWFKNPFIINEGGNVFQESQGITPAKSHAASVSGTRCPCVLGG